MRLIAKLDTEEEGKRFSNFLFSERIRNQCETVKGDVGSHCLIWVFEEDDVAISKQWVEEFLHNPQDAWFQQSIPSPTATAIHEAKERQEVKVRDFLAKGAALGYLTKTVMAICIAIFLMDEFHMEVFDGSFKQLMMFDLPVNPGHRWMGLYDEILSRYHQNVMSLSVEVPMFERIYQGELWRLFTPALLHGSLMHIGMNLLAFFAMGRQMEPRIGILKFALFIFLTGVIPNVCQYLMGGYTFVGISGVDCGMVMFVWTRRNLVPWEGYQMEPQNMKFMMLFVVGLAVAQACAFSLAMAGNGHFSVGIANTAHIMGGVVGWGLAKMDFFAWKR
ncbi:MAG: GlpG protein [Chlamydiales bacterium]|jgi:GlpG protein